MCEPKRNATSKGLAAGRDRSGDTSIAPRPLPHWTTAHDTSSHSLFATGGRRRPPSQVCRPVAPKVPSAPPHRFPSRGRAPDHGLTKCGQSLGQGLGAKCLRPPSSVIDQVGGPVRGVEARGVTHGLLLGAGRSQERFALVGRRVEDFDVLGKAVAEAVDGWTGRRRRVSERRGIRGPRRCRLPVSQSLSVSGEAVRVGLVCCTQR